MPCCVLLTSHCSSGVRTELICNNVWSDVRFLEMEVKGRAGKCGQDEQVGWCVLFKEVPVEMLKL